MAPWFLFAIIAVLLESLYSLFTKRLFNKGYDPILYGGLMQFTTGVLGISLIFFSGFRFVVTPLNLGLLALDGAAYTIASMLGYYGLSKVDLSKSVILNSSGLIWALGIGFVFFRESISPTKILALVCVVAAILIVSYRKNIMSSFQKYELMLLVSALVYAFGAALDKQLVASSNPQSYIVVSFLTAGSFVLLVNRKKLMTQKKKLFADHHFIKQLLINSGCIVLAYSFLFRAYGYGGELSKVYIVLQIQTILVALFGILILKERTHIARKVLATVLAFGGLLLVNG